MEERISGGELEMLGSRRRIVGKCTRTAMGVLYAMMCEQICRASREDQFGMTFFWLPSDESKDGGMEPCLAVGARSRHARRCYCVQ